MLVAEILSFVEEYGMVYKIADALADLLGKEVDLTIHNGKQLPSSLSITLSHTIKRRIQIHLVLIYEIHNRKYRTQLIWVQETQSRADGLNKRLRQ